MIVMLTNLKLVLRCTLVTGSFILLFAACKKNDKQAPKEITVEQVKTALNDNLFMNNMFNKTLQNQSKAKVGGRVENNIETVCPAFSLAIDSVGGFRITLGFDFGNGCPDDIAAGIIRRGRIDYSYNFTNNAVSIVRAKYTNYTEGFTTYNGEARLTYQYTPAAGNIFFAGTDGISINNSFYGNALYKAALTFKQTQGMATPLNYFDDVYETTGNSSAQTSNAGNISGQITKPLVNRWGCHYIVSGTIVYNFNGAEAIVDFGTGECDNKGTITINGQTQVFYF